MSKHSFSRFEYVCERLIHLIWKRGMRMRYNDVKTWFAVKYGLLCKNSYLLCGNRTTYSKHFYREGLNLFSFTFNRVIWRKTIFNTIKLSVRKYHHVQQRMWLWYAEFSFHCINREQDGCYLLEINYRLC